MCANYVVTGNMILLYDEKRNIWSCDIIDVIYVHKY